ncbi:hypothetical protein ETB97_004641 [Aspergillus alliaceus]|uniref:Uncharacterized protein n=1 Tax=Petromyces alliaceus TaxID=209559 RepID=A0A8H6A059_PETAA|nr:hypothetical protein ETB97_004641 [Aspergillus burnettii]
MQRMHLSREDFDNPEVAGAVNPHPDYGYFHGPIPNPNPGWRPHPDTRTPVTTADNEGAPTPGSRLSGINGMVCDIAVNGNQMCGQSIASQIALRRHIRNAHPGATLNPSRTNIPQAERIAGENALKQWVLSKGWRTARYVKEPGEGPKYSLIQDYCDFLEELAQEDNEFAQKFGTEFHRPKPGKVSSHKAGPSPQAPLQYAEHMQRKSSPDTPTSLSAPKSKRATPKKGPNAASVRKQPARGKKTAESVPMTA